MQSFVCFRSATREFKDHFEHGVSSYLTSLCICVFVYLCYVIVQTWQILLQIEQSFVAGFPNRCVRVGSVPACVRPWVLMVRVGWCRFVAPLPFSKTVVSLLVKVSCSFLE